MVQVPVCILFGMEHLGVGGPKPGSLHRFKSELGFNAQSLDLCREDRGINAGVYERTQSHVSRDAAETIKISNAHACIPAV